MSNLFQKLGYEAFRNGITPRTKESRDWFMKRVSDLRSSNINRRQLINDATLKKDYDGIVGNMYFFFYEAKYKDTLPYYDRFPLTIVVGPAPGGFYGINLHYLPPVLRAKFLDELLSITNNTKYDETTKFKLSYKLLSKASRMKYFKPCFKHYLNKHVKSHFARVSAPDYEIAVFLPTASWSNSNSRSVYADSRNKIS